MSAPATLLSAVPVPFQANGDLDVKGQETLLRHLKVTGIGGVFIAGTTGIHGGGRRRKSHRAQGGD
jgi:dihydrodipicolinate synthase/N-acetylneuraminate lyase